MDQKMALGFPHCIYTGHFEDTSTVSRESGEKGHQPNPILLKL